MITLNLIYKRLFSLLHLHLTLLHNDVPTLRNMEMISAHLHIHCDTKYYKTSSCATSAWYEFQNIGALGKSRINSIVLTNECI